MEPTTKALTLYAQLTPAMESIRATLFEQPAFDPATQSRTFHLGMRDWVETWLMPELMARVQQAAPGCGSRFAPAMLDWAHACWKTRRWISAFRCFPKGRHGNAGNNLP